MMTCAAVTGATVCAAGSRFAARTSAVDRALPSRTWWRISAGLARLAAAALAGCSYPPLPDTLVDGALADGAAADAAGPPPSSPLLLSEVVLNPNEAEMIEIVNTSSEAVDLSTYYLSDNGNYFRLPMQAMADTNDFIAKFPAGTMIAGHGVITVAVDSPANFASVYGISPTFSLADGTMDRVGPIGVARLTDTGEPVILFLWDGHSDLVTDVDIMIAGNPTTANPLINKSGAMQDGPDVDSQPTRYATDANRLAPQPAAPMPTMTPVQVFSTQRLLLEDGHENQRVAGNGQSGDDETSEDTSATWDGTAAHPFSVATPGQVPAALLR